MLESVDGEALRVLVVDEDIDSAISLALLLHSYGYAVEVATTGQTAIDIAQAANPDIVLLDFDMAGMDGWQVAAQLRCCAPTKKRPLLIAITGYGEQPERLRSYEAGIDLHLVKPVRMDQLQRILTKLRMLDSGCSPWAVPSNAHVSMCRAEAGPTNWSSSASRR
jgi:CheY-like chemotaxis protein